MTSKRGSKTADPAHRTGGGRRSKRNQKPDHVPGHPPGEQQIDESVEQSFPASDPPAHGSDPEMRVKDAAPVEGERDPDDDEGGIGGEVRRPQHEDENPDAVERGED